ncbi:hypothetical protein ER639_10280 [Macrococcus sp. DPC7161]|nr:hypothetical protein ER639_10280 [Macrococcus sp. DPC7161]
MIRNNRYYISFLAGPSDIRNLGIAWINLIFSLIYLVIINAYFDNAVMKSVFIVNIIFCMLCLAYHYMKTINQRYRVLSMVLVTMQVMMILFSIDFMALLMFLSGFRSETYLSFQNKHLVMFVGMMSFIFVISMIYFWRIYVKNNCSKRVYEKKDGFHINRHFSILACVILVMLACYFLYMGLLEALFGLLLALLCTVLFAALIVDAIYGVIYEVQLKDANKK